MTDGRILGHEAVGTITEIGDGTQAEFVRVPYADTSLYAVPDGVTNEQAIFLADSLPTGYEVGVLAGGVRPGDTVAVVGAGAVGLAAILTDGLGVEVAIEAVGYHETLLTAGSLVRPGGTIANIGVHGAAAESQPRRWARTRSPSTRWRRPTTCSRTRPRTWR